MSRGKAIRFVFCLIAFVATFATTGVRAGMSVSNFLANPGYEQKFSAWENDGWTLTDSAHTGKYAATTIVVNGEIRTLCSKPYAATRRNVSLNVTFKANAASNAQNAGRGYAIFFVRWLDANQARLHDTAYMTSDNAPRKEFITRAWVNAYRGDGKETYLQICVRAVSYASKPFVVAVDDWEASQ